MAAPTIYRSADAGAPVLFNGTQSLVDLLDACLVNGYGGAFAIGTITSDGVQPTDGDTVTVGVRTYTFRTSPSAAGDVLIGANATTTLQNLETAINRGNPSAFTTQTPASTLINPDAWASRNVLVITVQARVPGVAGNSIVLTRTAAGTPHIAVSAGGVLAGG